MAKRTNKAPAQPKAPNPNTPATAPVTPTAKPVLAKLAVKQGVALRGARKAWYEALCKYDGKTAAEFLAGTAETPPSLPKSGVAEKPSGWLAWFQRAGIATLETPAAAAQ